MRVIVDPLDQAVISANFISIYLFATSNKKINKCLPQTKDN